MPIGSEYAEEQGASCAVGRDRATEDCPWTLSSAAIAATPRPPSGRLVLPSPNGSMISFRGGRAFGTVVAASLRNGTAVANALIRAGYGSVERPIVVVASGGHWPDGSIRPCLEDGLGAGLVISQLMSNEVSPSPEAAALAQAWMTVEDVGSDMKNCASGRELISDSYEGDVEAASEVDVDTSVPLLDEASFTHSLELI